MGSFDSFRHRDYRLLWFGAVLSNVGTWMQATAVSWYVLELTHSAFWVTFVSFANFFPIVLSPIGGVFADRLNRKRMLLVTQSFLMTAAVILAVLSWFGDPTLVVVLILTFAQGLGFAFNGPTWMAFIPSLVPPEDMVNAVALNSAQYSLARVLGPAIAGIMIATSGVAPIFTINAASFVTVLLALLFIRNRPVAIRPHRTVAEELRSGFTYAWRNRVIRSTIIAIAMVSFFAGPVQALLPVFASEVYGRGAGAYGALAASLGIGSVLGALVVGRTGNRVGLPSVAIAMVGLGAVLVLFALIPSYPVALVLMALTGMAYLYAVAAGNGSLQVNVDESMRGRVMSISMLAFGAPFPIGAVVAGLAVETWGPAVTAVGASICAAWGAGLWWRGRGSAPRAVLEPGT